MTTLIEIPPGATSARHSHPGEDFGYVIAGTIVLQVDGKPPLTLKARNLGTTPARALDTYVIDQGKPGIAPAP
jgi:uncharacterized cupin superfamily protein